jgi:hypothetical protein
VSKLSAWRPTAARADGAISVVSIAGFAIALGSSGLILPLLAISSGYDDAAVGIFAAISAISQLGFRLGLPWLLRRFPDRSLIVAANVAMVGSFGLLIVTQSLPAFICAQLLQGSARALFWTASQTHAVRNPGGVVRSLAIVSAMSSVGQLVGPVVAGFVATRSLEAALAVASGFAVLGLVSGLVMVKLPPFAQTERTDGQRMWRRPGVDVACWASYSAGGWRAMISSLIPVALAAAGHPADVIGVLLMISEGTALAASGLLMRHRPPEVAPAIMIGVVLVAGALIGLPFVAAQSVLAALAMSLGGLGSGLLMNLGPALATQSVSPEDRGEAIAVAGTFRAGALLVTPSAAAAALTFVTLPIGLVVSGVVIGTPPVLAALRRARPLPATG